GGAVPFARCGRDSRLRTARRSTRRRSLRRGVRRVRQPALRSRAGGPAAAWRVRLDGAYATAAPARAPDALLFSTKAAGRREAEPGGPDAARRVARRWTTACRHRFALRAL